MRGPARFWRTAAKAPIPTDNRSGRIGRARPSWTRPTAADGARAAEHRAGDTIGNEGGGWHFPFPLKPPAGRNAARRERDRDTR